MRKVGRLAKRMINKILPEAALRPPPLQPIKYPCNAEYMDLSYRSSITQNRLALHTTVKSKNIKINFVTVLSFIVHCCQFKGLGFKLRDTDQKIKV